MIEKTFKNFQEEVELFFMTKFIFGETLKTVYSDCLDILFNITGTKDVTKGIIAYNPDYGQGKSFFFDVASHRHRRLKGKNLFVKTSAKQLCEIYTSTSKGSNPETRLLKFISVKRLYIDDIGDELKEGAIRSNYSNKLNVIRWVLLKRYEFWLEKGWKTYGTTNLTIEEIAKHYDGRVADRLMQMTYFKEFKFLSKGSFRQLTSTRKLTPEEIQVNLDKFKPEEKVEKVDLEKYFNELIQEPEENFKEKGTYFWKFVKDYLERKGLLTEEDYNKIDEKMLDSSELLLRKDVRDTKRGEMRHAPGNVRSNAIEKALEAITGSEVYDASKNIVAKRKFLELQKQNHIFK